MGFDLMKPLEAIREYLKRIMKRTIRMGSKMDELVTAVRANNELTQKILDTLNKVPPSEDLQPVIDLINADGVQRQAIMKALQDRLTPAAPSTDPVPAAAVMGHEVNVAAGDSTQATGK